MSITFMNPISRVAIAARAAERRRPLNWNELAIQGDCHRPFAKIEARTETLKWRVIFAFVVILAALIFDLQPAKAYEPPWCAVISDGYWDCQYRSIEECRPYVLAGNRGWCNPSPYFVAPYQPTEHRHYRQRHTRRSGAIG